MMTEPPTSTTSTDLLPSDGSMNIMTIQADKVKQMIQACRDGNLHIIQSLMTENPLYASQQEHATGQSPLMAAAAVGNLALCRHLLEFESVGGGGGAGAPWNAVDRQGLCAGDYATQHEHWEVVNLLVDWGVKAELILGRIQRHAQQQPQAKAAASATQSSSVGVVVQAEHEQPCTKPDYLQQKLSYTSDGQALLDRDQDAVMMQWERPLMRAHAQILMEENNTNNNASNDTTASQSQTQQQQRQSQPQKRGKTVLNVGFGMGIIDTILQEEFGDTTPPSLHYIIEAHPDVHRHMIAQGWDKKPNVCILFGKWQDVLPKLIAEKVTMDAIFFDTYGEHYMDLEDFHAQLPYILSKPHGIYSFFNGLAPDNLFFHGVACQCVKLQLAQLGLDSEFLPCEIQAVNQDIDKSRAWDGVRRKYWYGRDTYYLPRVVWNEQYLVTGTIRQELDITTDASNNSGKHSQDEEMQDDDDTKRQRT